MQVARAQQAIAAAAVTLVVWVLGVAAFLPPLVTRYTTKSVPLMIVIGIGIAVSAVLHLVFVGVAAKRLGRSPVLWVVITLCGFPIVSIIGLILFEWFSDEKNQSPA